MTAFRYSQATQTELVASRLEEFSVGGTIGTCYFWSCNQRGYYNVQSRAIKYNKRTLDTDHIDSTLIKYSFEIGYIVVILVNS